MPAPLLEPIFLPNLGIDLRKPEQFLQQQTSPYTRNMEFFNERLQGRGGCAKWDSILLSGPITLIKQYWRLSGSYDLIVATTKDIYKKDFTNSRYDILTRVYQTGTVEVQAGTPTVLRGTGTSWSASNVKVGDYVKLSDAGSTHHTGQTWYTVASLDYGAQTLTMTASMPTTAAGAAYTARLTFTSSTTDMWDGKQFLDDAEGNVFLMTNGVDTPVWYNGTGQVQLFTGMPAGVTTCKFFNIFFDRLIWLWTREAGANQPMRVRWSAVADFLTYNAAHVVDLVLPQADSWISGSYLFGDALVVTKEQQGYIVTHIGGDTIFDFQFASTLEGNFAPFSIIPVTEGAYYYGVDDRFRFYNNLRDQPALDGILPYAQDIDPDGAELMYGIQISNKTQFRWVLPYDALLEASPVVVYDYEVGVPIIWEYKLAAAAKIRCIGEFLNVADLYVDDAAWASLYVDTVTPGFWDDRDFLENAPVIVYGCEDGYIRLADSGADDDGTAFNRTFDSKRLDFRLPHMNKRLWVQEWWFDVAGSGTVTVKLKKGDKTSFEVATKSITLTSATKDIIKQQVRWDKEADNFQMRLEATNFFALLGVLNWYFPKKRRCS